jgi:argininosuccinate lyase
LQETKPPLVNSAKTMISSLKVLVAVLSSVNIKSHNMLEAATDPFVIATDLVEYLVKKGVPFRTAHEQIGQLFAYCRNTSANPTKLALSKLQSFAPELEADALSLFDALASANSKTSAGGTGSERVAEAIAHWKSVLVTPLE